jgi:beta-carotene ketolase (CrtW type)
METKTSLSNLLIPTPPKGEGVWVGVAIIAVWLLAVIYGLGLKLDWYNPVTYLLVLIITHLYTGLFITAHDAMHGLVSPNARLNTLMGTVTALLFAYNWYPRLLTNHKLHHAHAATMPDPDWNPGNFLVWYISFAKHYVTVWQILAMAVTYNLLKLWVPMENLIVFWEIPAILSTLQLFYFGTYLPHRGEHSQDDPYKAKSQPLNHTWAFLSCYFFGYHNEHHAMPWLPWYKLPAAREFTHTEELKVV